LSLAESTYEAELLSFFAFFKAGLGTAFVGRNPIAPKDRARVLMNMIEAQ